MIAHSTPRPTSTPPLFGDVAPDQERHGPVLSSSAEAHEQGAAPPNGASGDDALVTYLMCTFNQEAYVREAVESAFSQTYEPLEIILSDDCSTDGTADILEDLARNYRGPHSVRFVRNQTNLGVIAHVLVRGREARGNIVVVAAGDDLSVPGRTTALVAAFDDGVGAAYSQVTLIDTDGRVLVDATDQAVTGEKAASLLRHEERKKSIQGSSAAYRKWVFDIPLNETPRGYHEEDLLFAFYLGLLGAEVRRLDEPLVKYRVHDKALTNSVRYNVSAGETWTNEMSGRALQRLNDYEYIARSTGNIHLVNMRALNSDRAFLEDANLWPELSFLQRLKRAVKIRVGRGSDRRKTVWKLARIWGNFPHYQPKLFLSRFQKRHKPQATQFTP